MSSTNELKNCLAEAKISSIKLQKAYLSAILKTSESFHIDRYGVNFEITTDNAVLGFKIIEILKNCFDMDIDLNMSTKNDSNLNKYSQYTVKMPSDKTRLIGEELQLLEYEGDRLVHFNSGSITNLASKAERKAYLHGVMTMLSSLTLPLVDPNDNMTYTGGYHYEMQFNDEVLATDIADMLLEYGIVMKTIVRGEMHCLYLKDSDTISDICALANATDLVMKIQEINHSRYIRNVCNRQNNCALANIDKAVEASQKQYLGIKQIIATIGLDALPEKLREMALLRLEYPDYTLSQLGELLAGEVSKSGANHRMRKLMSIADSLTKEEETNG